MATGLLLLVAALGPGDALARQDGLIPGLPATSNSATNRPETPPAEAEPVDPEFGSARATLRTFLGAFSSAGNGNVGLAVRCLDLGGLPESLWAAKGPELAIHLKGVIDRIEDIDFETVPDDPDGEPWVFFHSPDGEIAIARKSTGQWLFTRETVTAIPSLMRALENRPPVTSVRDDPQFQTRYQRARRVVPTFLRGKGLLLEHWQWIALAVCTLAGVLVWRTIPLLLGMSLGKLIRYRWDSLSEADVRKGFGPIGLLAMSILWLNALSWLGLPLWMHTILLVAGRFIAVVSTVLSIFGVLELFMLSLRKRASMADSTIDLLLVPLVRTSMRIVIAVVALAIFAENFDIEITGLLAGLGLGGVAIALAAKDTLGNFFGSLTVILDKPFRAGDWVKIGTVEGKVEEVGLRSTRIRTLDDSLVTMPNLTLTATAVENLGMRRWRRWKTTVQIRQETPPERVEQFCAGILELVKARTSTMRQDRVTAAVSGFSPGAIDVGLVLQFAAADTPTENRLRHEFAIEVLRLAHRLEVELASGSQTVVMTGQDATPVKDQREPLV